MDLLPQPIAEAPQAIEKEFFDSEEWCEGYGPLGWPEYAAIIDSMSKDVMSRTAHILMRGSIFDDFPF